MTSRSPRNLNSIVFGVALFMVAFGLLIRFRGGSGTSSHAAIVGAQVVLGVGKSPLFTE